MFVILYKNYDKLVPMFSNANFNPKMEPVENCVFNNLGRGNWKSSSEKCLNAMRWSSKPWELVVAGNGTIKSDQTIREVIFT